MNTPWQLHSPPEYFETSPTNGPCVLTPNPPFKHAKKQLSSVAGHPDFAGTSGAASEMLLLRRCATRVEKHCPSLAHLAVGLSGPRSDTEAARRRREDAASINHGAGGVEARQHEICHLRGEQRFISREIQEVAQTNFLREEARLVSQSCVCSQHVLPRDGVKLNLEYLSPVRSVQDRRQQRPLPAMGRQNVVHNAAR
eukprot:1512566-Rhodomonas_salina.2